MMTSPMTRDESVKILGIETALKNIKDDIDPEDIMTRFDDLFSKNNPEAGGSFYLQSKIFFAKEFLMQDHPSELNISKYNPSDEVEESDGEVEEKDEESKKEEESKNKKE